MMPTQNTGFPKTSPWSPTSSDQGGEQVIYQRLNASFDEIAAFCDRWHIQN